eukprot:5608460-Alexandrium_andersonii.AAC.1
MEGRSLSVRWVGGGGARGCFWGGGALGQDLDDVPDHDAEDMEAQAGCDSSDDGALPLLEGLDQQL